MKASSAVNYVYVHTDNGGVEGLLFASQMIDHQMFFLYKIFIIKQAENTLPELLLLFYSIEPQMSTIYWFGFFFKQKR